MQQNEVDKKIKYSRHTQTYTYTHVQRMTQINTHGGYLAQAAALMKRIKDCTQHAGSIFPDSYTWVAISFPWQRRSKKKMMEKKKLCALPVRCLVGRVLSGLSPLRWETRSLSTLTLWLLLYSRRQEKARRVMLGTTHQHILAFAWMEKDWLKKL